VTHAAAVARLVAAVLLLVGSFGFIPGVTSHYDDMTFSGHGSGAQLLGIFQVSILLNVVHLVSGIAGLALARARSGPRTFFVIGGLLYVALSIAGVGNGADWLPVDGADNWLHLGFGLAMLALGFATRLGPHAPHQNDAARTT